MVVGWGIFQKIQWCIYNKKLEACFRGKENNKNNLQAFYFEGVQQY